MKTWGAAILFCGLVSRVLAYDFGPVEALRSSHPGFFVSGRVSVATNGNTVYYIYNGVATRRFSQMPYSQLRTIAKMRAEGTLAKFLCNGENTYDVSIKGGLQIARHEEGNRVLYLFAVPTSGVSRTKCQIVAGPPSVAHSNVTDVAKAETQDFQGSRPSLLKLSDAVDLHPEDGVLRSRLAKAYFDARMYDEAELETSCAVKLLQEARNEQHSDEQVEALLGCADIMMQIGDYKSAGKIFHSVKDMGDTRFLPAAMQGISAVNLKLGL